MPTPQPLDPAALRALGVDVLDSVDLPIIVIGRDFVVASFNPAAATLLSLTPSDVGRPLRGIRMLSEVTDLHERCEHAIGGASSQHEVRDGAGSWFFLRIAPCTGIDQITGAVLTLTNVTAFRASLEQAIYEREYTKAIINAVIDPLVVLDDHCRVQAANQAFYAMFQVSREQVQGVRLYDLGSRDWDIPRLQRFLNEPHTNNQSDALEFEHEFPEIGRRLLLFNARRLSRQGNLGQMNLLAIRDITDRKRAEAEREKLVEQLQTERVHLKHLQAQLQEKITDLEKFHDVVVGRELKLMQLEKDNQELRSRLKGLGLKPPAIGAERGE